MGKPYSGNTYKKIRVGDKFVNEHRHKVEQFLGRKLQRFEIVHHKDHDITNNNLDNLEVISHADHMKLHNTKYPNGCTFNSCGKPNFCKGLCSKHYHRNKKYGDPSHTERIQYDYSKDTCKVTNCSSQFKMAKGYCSKHYSKWKNHGNPLWKRPKFIPQKCLHITCNRNALCKRYCQTHWRQIFVNKFPRTLDIRKKALSSKVKNSTRVG